MAGSTRVGQGARARGVRSYRGGAILPTTRQTGPCGPDTEIFYWTGAGSAPERLDPADSRWIEIWNNVFMDHTQTASGTVVRLPHLNVDTGMDVERMLVALNGLENVYQIDTIRPLADCEFRKF